MSLKSHANGFPCAPSPLFLLTIPFSERYIFWSLLKNSSTCTSAVNHWNNKPGDLFRMKTDETGTIRCIACHGSPHAIYPAKNPFDRYRDVIQPMQYQKNPFTIGANESCFVCHTQPVGDPPHHGNMFRKARVKGGF